MTVVLYVEGGGDKNHDLATDCRKGFSVFLKKAGLQGQMPRIVASGSRQEAYKDFFKKCQQGHAAILLVDSEDPISPDESAWAFLKRQDNWDKPDAAGEDDCHLMVQCMESWFLADRKALADYFGQEFKPHALPGKCRDIETLPKKDVLDGLKRATKYSTKKYSKGLHSFDILAKIDPNLVMKQSGRAKRLVECLKHPPAPCQSHSYSWNR